MNYGINTNYNLSATDGNLVTSHKLTLNSELLLPGTKYYFVVKGTDAAGNAVASSSQSFRTQGVTLTLTVLDQNKKPVSGATVTVAEVSGTTDTKGKVTLKDLPVGKTTATIKYKGKQHSVNLEVKPISSPELMAQTASATIRTSGSSSWLAILLLVVVLLGAGGGFMRIRGKNKDNLQTHFPDFGTTAGGATPGATSNPPAGGIPPAPQAPATGNTQPEPTVIRPTNQPPTPPQP